MSMDVTLPDGTVIKGVPDGTTRQQLAEKLKAKGMNVPDSWLSPSRKSPINQKKDFEQRYQAQQDKMVSSMDTLSIGVPGVPSMQVNVPVPGAIARGAAGAGKAVYDTARGLGELVGLEKPEDVARSRVQDEALMRTGAGKVGNVLGYVGEAIPLSRVAPGLGTGVLGAVGTRMALGGLTGGAQGYTAPYASQGEHVANTLVGAGLGAALPGGGALASNVMRGLANPTARELIDAGVRLTPGQMLGGIPRRLEESAKSLPVVGSAIRKAEQRAMDDFNLAAVQKALAPIGAKLGKGVEAGYEAVEQGRKFISDRYDSVLGQMKGRVDSQLTNKIASTLSTHINSLPDNLARHLMQTVDQDVLQKLGKGQWVGGKEVKEVISSLGSEVRTAAQSADPAYRQLSKAFQSVQNDVKAMLKRNNSKELGEQLSDVDAAHARMLRVENAASRVGTDEGKFTASQLKAAVRAEDSSYQKRGFGTGNALMQDLADAGKRVLPAKMPDSGTAERLRLLETAAMLIPGMAAHAAYSRMGQSMARAALAPKANPVSNYLAQLAQQRLGNPANVLAARAFAPQPVPQVPQQ